MIGATVLALTAAVLHAGWNLKVKRSDDPFIALWGQFAGAALLAGVLLVVLGLPERASWPFIAASSCIHLPYAVALSRAYGAADFSLAYPLARGGGALAAAVGGLVVLDDRLSTIGWVAVFIVGVGLVSFVRPGTSLRSLRWAAVVAVLIGIYSVVDAAGSRRSSGIGYVLVLFVGTFLTVSAWGVAHHKGRALLRSLPTSWRQYLGTGLASAAAYGAVLVAVRSAPVGYVTALRESSVVLGALAGWHLLSEGLGRARVASSAVVLGGLILLVAVR